MPACVPVATSHNDSPASGSARRSSPPIAAIARRSCTKSARSRRSDRRARHAASHAAQATPAANACSRDSQPFSSNAPSAQAKARSASAAKAVCASQRGSSFIMRKRSRRSGHRRKEAHRRKSAESKRTSTVQHSIERRRNALNFCRALPKLHEAHRSGGSRVESNICRNAMDDSCLLSSSRAVKSRAAYCRECAAAGLRARLCQIVIIMHR